MTSSSTGIATPVDRSARPDHFIGRFARHRGALLGASLLLAVIAMALAAGLLYPGNALRIVAAPETWPLSNPAYPLGTDAMGRDIAAMIVHGARATLLIGLAAAA
ncbi:ABC-type dipeptide/oligopeptide/nickel transport system, permease component, partial [Herbaspirillum sp. YR522]